MKAPLFVVFTGTVVLLLAASMLADNQLSPKKEEAAELGACAQSVAGGFLKIAPTRDVRFQGKVTEPTARCRGGMNTVNFRFTPWVDWSNYWGAGDNSSLPVGFLAVQPPKFRGVSGALLDLEYERIELIKFNLFDNSGTYQAYVAGRGGVPGQVIKTWPEMRLPASNPDYQAVGGDGPQVCSGSLIRARTLTGICNDIRNPLMGSTGMPFARNVEFDATFPDLETDHPDEEPSRWPRRPAHARPATHQPQAVHPRAIESRPLAISDSGLPNNSVDANCDYQKAPFFNVLAAYWIQLMTHDWFSHMEEGHNAAGYMKRGLQDQAGQRRRDAADSGGGPAARLPPG